MTSSRGVICLNLGLAVSLSLSLSLSLAPSLSVSPAHPVVFVEQDREKEQDNANSDSVAGAGVVGREAMVLLFGATPAQLKFVHTVFSTNFRRRRDMYENYLRRVYGVARQYRLLYIENCGPIDRMGVGIGDLDFARIRRRIGDAVRTRFVLSPLRSTRSTRSELCYLRWSSNFWNYHRNFLNRRELEIKAPGRKVKQ